jgi:pimeloyl-ACP methyl ester carboxylesterase
VGRRPHAGVAAGLRICEARAVGAPARPLRLAIMKRTLGAALFALGLAAAVFRAHPAAAGPVELEIGAGPATAGLIVCIPGSGCTPAANQARDFFRGMPGHWRITVLEKPGLDGRIRFGCSAAFHAATDYASLIARQSQFAAQMLAQHHDAPVKLLVGYSEGGTVAPYVAAAAPGFTRMIVAAAGAMPGEAETQISFAQVFGSDGARRTIAAIKSAPTALDRFALGETYRYWASLFDLQPMQAYRALALPVLMIHGDRDTVVPVEATRFARAQFAAFGQTNLTVHELPGAGHGLFAGNPAKRGAMWAQAAVWMQAQP